MISASAPDQSFIDTLRTELAAVLNGARTGQAPPPVIGGPATDAERQLARSLGPAIVAGAQQVLRDPSLAAVEAGLRASPAEEVAVATAALLARTLLRWRPELLRIGGAALYAGNPDEAELAATVVLATTGGWNTHPENGAAFLLLGRAARLRNDLGSALENFEAAVQLARGRAPALAGNALDSLGLVLADLGRPDDALDAFSEAEEVEPTDAGRIAIVANRAMVLTNLGECRAAAAAASWVVEALEDAGASPARLAIGLDNLAVSCSQLGEDQAALAALNKAQALLLDTGAPIDRARNQLSRWSVLHEMGNPQAHEAFADAYRIVAEARSNIDLRHYTEGFVARTEAAAEAAHARLVAELGDEAAADARHSQLMHAAQQALQAGLDAAQRAEWETADELLARAEILCEQAGAPDGRVQAASNRAVIRLDSGAIGDAIQFVQRSHTMAVQLGAARQVLAALANMANLSLRGADVASSIGPLDPLLQASAIAKALPAIADGLGLQGRERAGFLWGDGGIDDMLACYCADHDAHDLAAPHWERSLAAARAFGPDPGSQFRLANRLANRLLKLPAGDRDLIAPALSDELQGIVTANPGLAPVQVTGCRALGEYLTEADPPGAIGYLEAAAAAQARLAGQVPPGKRPGVIAANPVPFSRLAQLLAAVGDPARAWCALQGNKGRRVIEAVGNDGPVDLGAVQRALAALDEHAVIVDIASVPAGIMAFIVGRSSCAAVGPIPTPPRWLEQAFRGDVREHDARAVEACLNDPVLAAFVAAIESQLPPGASVLLVPAQPLDNLPLHLIPASGRPWGASRQISLLPAAGLVTSFSGASGGRPTRSLVAGDSDCTLRWASKECVDVARALATEPLLGPACTFDAVATALAGDRLDVIHLALHGRGDSTRGGRAALRFATPDGTAWVPFDELLALGLNAELVFLSGCSTALSGPVHGQGAVSAAQAALEAGAGAVIGCLWPVEDQAAAAYATAFYDALVPAWEAGPADAREAMASARQAVQGGATAPHNGAVVRRDGRRNLSPDTAAEDLDPVTAQALRWAPFVLVGDPIVAG